jgi:hypothetical protein
VVIAIRSDNIHGADSGRTAPYELKLHRSTERRVRCALVSQPNISWSCRSSTCAPYTTCISFVVRPRDLV